MVGAAAATGCCAGWAWGTPRRTAISRLPSSLGATISANETVPSLFAVAFFALYGGGRGCRTSLVRHRTAIVLAMTLSYSRDSWILQSKNQSSKLS